MSYEYADLLPKEDSAYVDYENFKAEFGGGQDLIVVGVQDSNFFQLDNIRAWQSLTKELKSISGVEGVISPTAAINLHKDVQDKKFTTQTIFPDSVTSQTELDSCAAVLNSLPIYRGLLSNPQEHAYIMGVVVSKEVMATKSRDKMVLNIKKCCDAYGKQTNHYIHYSGLPYVRVISAIKIKKEIYLFSALAMLLCVVILYLFFRSFKAVLIPAIIVLCGVIWALGTMGIMGYKITLLTGMLPSLLIVIGIPNSIYMLNKYHYEYRAHGNKIKALQRVIIKIGNATFLTNLTTASGFATFLITNSDILRQFGFVASLNILALFLLSLIMIPSIFSFLAPPDERHVKHLDNKNVQGIINNLVKVTTKHIKLVYAGAIAIVCIGAYGITLITSTGYMVDDISEKDPIYQDLKFFERNVEGVMPLEIIIDTKKPGKVLNLSTLRLIDKLETRLEDYSELSSSLSLLNGVKFAKQAFYNGNENYYKIPTQSEMSFLMRYAKNSTKGSSAGLSSLNSLMDSTQQITRVSVRVKDVGTQHMDSLYHAFQRDVKKIFPAKNYNVTVTGTSVTFFKGTQYLVKNLFSSLALAIFLISLFMAAMFRSWRMVVLSLIPNILPLIFTAAIMGFTGISIKSSTILVFSIAFGISVDNTIHFLAKYRMELSNNNSNIRLAVMSALNETGVSMLYTFVVLFFGFGIYSLSQFGGTAALGTLVSLTLLVAVAANLILLPSLLIGLERLTTTKNFEQEEPIIDIFVNEKDIQVKELKLEDLEGESYLNSKKEEKK
ncbi:MAG: efflux RND transporter permease subunit [Mangrovibacterium sp.]